MQNETNHNIEILIEIGKIFYGKNWFLGTSGNLSYLSRRDPLTFVVTASGVDKGGLTPDDFVVVGPMVGHARVDQMSSDPKPSGETPLHKAIYSNTDAGCIIHVHSVQALLVADINSKNSAFEFKGFEIQKGLGSKSPSDTFRVPIIENNSDLDKLSQSLVGALQEDIVAVLVRGHGLFCWGDSVAAARRHVELLHHMFDYDIETAGMANCPIPGQK